MISVIQPPDAMALLSQLEAESLKLKAPFKPSFARHVCFIKRLLTGDGRDIIIHP